MIDYFHLKTISFIGDVIIFCDRKYNGAGIFVISKFNDETEYTGRKYSYSQLYSFDQVGIELFKNTHGGFTVTIDGVDDV